MMGMVAHTRKQSTHRKNHGDLSSKQERKGGGEDKNHNHRKAPSYTSVFLLPERQKTEKKISQAASILKADS